MSQYKAYTTLTLPVGLNESERDRTLRDLENLRQLVARMLFTS